MKSPIYKTKDASHDVIIMVGRNENGRIRKPITSIKVKGVPIKSVVEWIKNAIATDLEHFGTLDIKKIEEMVLNEDR